MVLGLWGITCVSYYGVCALLCDGVWCYGFMGFGMMAIGFCVYMALWPDCD